MKQCDNEVIAKDLNEIYLRTIGNFNSDFNVSDISTLSQIANLCPLAAGPSVYVARALYALKYPETLYNDAPVCLVEGYYREAAKEIFHVKPKQVLEVSIYPNPAKTSVTIQFSENQILKELKVTNLVGEPILQQSFKDKQKTVKLNTEQISPGVYLVTLHFENQSISKKLIISR